MSNATIPDLRRRTRQALSIAKSAVLAEATAVVAAHGPSGLIVTHLARNHDVAPLTVRRWLTQARFDLEHLTRGRPSFQKLDAVAVKTSDADVEKDVNDV